MQTVQFKVLNTDTQETNVQMQTENKAQNTQNTEVSGVESTGESAGTKKKTTVSTGQTGVTDAEMSLSCPRLRPIINNEKINPLDVHEKQLCQVLCAYRIFLPYAGITVSSRESASFRNGIIKIACTKVSAGVSTGIGDHEAKYEGSEEKDCGDEQFEIADTRSLKQMYNDIKQQGLWPVLNDYLYV